jgi:dTDP-4-amino-4,6-dideoxygalactose transaminase
MNPERTIPLFKVFMSNQAKANVQDVLNSGYIGQGSYVEKFEELFANYVKSDKPIISLNSATSGLQLACYMIGLREGDEVITTPITCTATQTGIVSSKATIVWGDVDPRTGLLDVDDVRAKMTKHTKAIIATNWGGRKPNYVELKKLGVPVIEDAAHGPYEVTENSGDYIVWSTQAIKFLTTGDGGMLYCPDPERARLLRWYGLDRRSSKDFRCAQDIQEAGFKYHMNDIAAAIGCGNIRYLKSLINAHKRHARVYENLLTVDRPSYDPECPYWIYTIFCKNPTLLSEQLKNFGIDSSPVHARNDKHTAFRRIAKYSDNTGVVEYDSTQLNIPVGWWLDRNDTGIVDDLGYIADIVNALVERMGL